MSDEEKLQLLQALFQGASINNCVVKQVYSVYTDDKSATIAFAEVRGERFDESWRFEFPATCELFNTPENKKVGK